MVIILILQIWILENRIVKKFAQDHMTRVVELGFELWQSTCKIYLLKQYIILPLQYKR